MKIFKTIILGMVFLFGLTAMSNVKDVAVSETDCSDDFNRCNVQFPDSYKDFDSCMRQNGC